MLIDPTLNIAAYCKLAGSVLRSEPRAVAIGQRRRKLRPNCILSTQDGSGLGECRSSDFRYITKQFHRLCPQLPSLCRGNVSASSPFYVSLEKKYCRIVPRQEPSICHLEIRTVSDLNLTWIGCFPRKAILEERNQASKLHLVDA
jgi:hypothetical protein